MKKSTIFLIITIMIVILIISSLVVYAQNQETKPTLEDKVTEEINYLNNYIISMLGYFNGLTLENTISDKANATEQLEKEDTNMQNSNSQEENQGGSEEGNSQSEDEQQNNSDQSNESNTQNTIANATNNILSNKGKYETKWDKIEEQIENLYQTWNTISVDLHSLNIDGQSILEFSNKLNSATQNIKNRNKEKAMLQLTSIYQLLPQYMQSYKPNEQETKMLEIQSNIITSYTAVTNEKWDEATEQLTETEQKFATIINSVTDQTQNQTVMNQCYILVNELRSAVNLKDKEIFYIQFQNLIRKSLLSGNEVSEQQMPLALLGRI